MPQPGKPAPRGEDWFVRKFADLERQMQELRAANPFGLTGVTPEDGGTSFDGYMKVNGPMTVDGDADFQGNMKVSGTLNLPGGIIGNDALSSPLSPRTAHADVTNFSLATGANVEKVRATVTVPDGYSQALVMASATLSARNSTAALDAMYIDCRINGAVSGWSSMTSVDGGSIGHAVNIGTALLTGLGGTFYIAANASSGLAGWAASSNNNNAINIDAIVVFLR